MTPRARSRMMAIILVVLGLSLATGLALYGLSNKITYFKTPTDIATGEGVTGSFRLGGMVKDGTLTQSGETHYFVVTDFANDLNVAYRGILPDLFREGQGIVATGQYDPETNLFTASQILAKHDENYMPPDVKRAMDRQQQQP